MPRALALLAALAALPAAAAERLPYDPDFDEPPQPPSLAFGGLSPGQLRPWLEVGWLRSGLGVDVGLGAGFDLGLRFDAFLLKEGFGDPSTTAVALRWTPPLGDVRASLSVEAAQVFGEPAGSDVFSGRGELTVGTTLLGRFTVYGRAMMRAILAQVGNDETWERDGELGAGVEWILGDTVVGGEVFAWTRPALPALGQWRLRVAHAF